MLETFFATLEPMLMLFTCIAIGFLAKKTNILPDNAGKVMAKLETWIFCPALSFSTMSTYFTLDTVSTHAVNILFGICCVALGMAFAIPLGKWFIREKCPERGIYMYALAFANGGYVSDPVILAMFGGEVLSYYKLFYLPFSIMIYTWGISVLVSDGEHKGNVFKKVMNAPTIAMLIGIVFGLTGARQYLPSFLTSSLDSLKACMGPVAMLLAGFTIASYDMKEMLKNKKVYLATALRLVVLPTILVGALFGIKELVNILFDIQLDHFVLFLAFFACAAPLGLNTVVFPEAYGGSPKTGASMALISHTLCVISIPIMYALMVAIFGPMPTP